MGSPKVGAFLGQEKDAPSTNGGKTGGFGKPPIHSHSATKKTLIKGTGNIRKRHMGK